MQPECTVPHGRRYEIHRHCPSCHDVIPGLADVYITHAWTCPGPPWPA